MWIAQFQCEPLLSGISTIKCQVSLRLCIADCSSLSFCMPYSCSLHDIVEKQSILTHGD